MKEQKQEMKLPKLDDLFTSQAQRDYKKAEKVVDKGIKYVLQLREKMKENQLDR